MIKLPGSTDRRVDVGARPRSSRALGSAVCVILAGPGGFGVAVPTSTDSLAWMG
nr:hypothetical protein JVH1_6051 [Rhodococcus sp. JVH1]